MKRYILSVAVLFLIFLVVGSCDRTELVSDGEGALRMNVTVKDAIKVNVTRGMSEEEQARLQEECLIRLYSQNGLVRYYNGVEELPEEILLKAGEYTAVVTAGDSVDVSYDKTYYKAVEPVSIVAGQTTPVDIVTTIFNTVAVMDFDPTLEEGFSTYQVTVSSVKGELLFSRDGENKGYYIVPEEEAYLDYEFKGTSLQGVPYIKKNRMEVAPSTQYDFSFSYQETEYSGGGAELVVTVNSTPLSEETDTVTLQQRPTFHGIFDHELPYYISSEEEEEIEVWIAAGTLLESVIVKCDRFAGWALPTAFDVMKLKQGEASDLKQKGISPYYKYDFVTGKSNLKITFSKDLVAAMALEKGETLISFSATDQNGRNRSENLIFITKDGNVTIREVLPYEVWATSAIFRGRVLFATQEDVYFQYRKTGELNWNRADVDVMTDTEFYSNITGLELLTSYEYCLVEGEKESDIYTFVTEGAQLPNHSFESWSGSLPMLIYNPGNDETMFWDSGNHGSASVSLSAVDITTWDASICVDGSYSAKLQSQYVSFLGMGKFAAGNIFAGEYIDLVGTAGAKLSFGRPFTSRPQSLKGWYKYISTAITDTDKTLTEELINEGAVAGQNDKGYIYIALGDWDSPLQINSANRPNDLFDVNDSHIIAFGELVQSESTDGDGMHEFTIPLEYRTQDRKPTHIVIVASSSKYGDYFTGGRGSTLWLDDLELIYE